MRQGVDCLRGFQFKFTISLSYPLHPALRALRMRTMPHSLLARIMKRPPHMFSFVIKILDNSIKTLQQQKQQQYQYQVKQPPWMPHCSISAISLAAGLSGTQASQTGLCGDQPCTGVMTVHIYIHKFVTARDYNWRPGVDNVASSAASSRQMRSKYGIRSI